MEFLYTNVYIGKDDKYNYSFNILYWLVKLMKDIFKWIYAASLFAENKTFFALAFICPCLRFALISIQNFFKFKVNFRGHTPLIIISVIILIIESFFELPIHLMFPVNKIYLHTNYYRIYDKKVSCPMNINLEIAEGLILLGYLMWYFCFGKFHYSAVILIIFVVPLLAYLIGARIYFCCYDKDTNVIQNNTINNNKEKTLVMPSDSKKKDSEPCYEHVIDSTENMKKNAL